MSDNFFGFNAQYPGRQDDVQFTRDPHGNYLMNIFRDGSHQVNIHQTPGSTMNFYESPPPNGGFGFGQQAQGQWGRPPQMPALPPYVQPSNVDLEYSYVDDEDPAKQQRNQSGQLGLPAPLPQLSTNMLPPGPLPAWTPNQGNQSSGLGIPSPPSSTVSLPPTLFGPSSPVAPTPAVPAPPYSPPPSYSETSKPPTGRRTRSHRGK